MIHFKSMSKKEKVEYIWDYYKLHIMGALILVLILGSIIRGQVTKVDYVFNLTMIGNVKDESKRINLEKQITSLVINQGGKRKQAIVDVIPTGSSNSNDSLASSQYMQKFITQLFAGELDVVVLDKGMFETLVSKEAFSKLDNIAQLDLASIKSEKIEASGSDNDKAIYAISAENIKIFRDMGFDTRNKVICIINSSKQKGKAALVLKWLLTE